MTTTAQTFARDRETKDLVDTADRFLASNWPVSTPPTTSGVEVADVRRMWSASIGLGWPWIAYRDQPSAALSAAPTLVALFASSGRNPAPVPLGEACIWLPLLAAVENSGVTPDHLAGTRLLTVATRSHDAAGDVWGGAHVDGTVVSGAKVAVAGGLASDTLVVAAQADDGPCLAVLERDQPGVSLSAMPCYDRLDSPALLHLDRAAVTGTVRGAAATEIVAVANVLERVATAAELSALASSAVRLAIEHTSQRQQFKRAVGSFQAVKHLLAEAWIDVYAAESAAQSAADRIAVLGNLEQALRQADCALAFANGAARRAVEAALQAHGGIGFILEYRLSQYFNRVLSRSAVGGSPRELLRGLGLDAVAGHLAVS